MKGNIGKIIFNITMGIEEVHIEYKIGNEKERFDLVAFHTTALFFVDRTISKRKKLPK